jgi:hypothetical protein
VINRVSGSVVAILRRHEVFQCIAKPRLYEQDKFYSRYGLDSSAFLQSGVCLLQSSAKLLVSKRLLCEPIQFKRGGSDHSCNTFKSNRAHSQEMSGIVLINRIGPFLRFL